MKTSTERRMLALAVALAAGSAWAQVAGVIITTDNKAMDGLIRWKARDKAYAIKKGDIELELTPAMVQTLQIPRPRELDAAVNSIQQGSPAAAIPVLEKIAADYLMLQWDTVATRLLADAHVKAGNADQAIRVCEKVIAANPEAAYLGEMAPAYWQALLKSGRTAKLDDLATKAIKSGDREASAFALILRGDLILAAGDTNESHKKALRDGYLRVVTLYKAVKAAQPEALYKAGKSFEKLGQTARADQMRTTLKNEYAATEWARKP